MSRTVVENLAKNRVFAGEDNGFVSLILQVSRSVLMLSRERGEGFMMGLLSSRGQHRDFKYETMGVDRSVQFLEEINRFVG